MKSFIIIAIIAAQLLTSCDLFLSPTNPETGYTITLRIKNIPVSDSINRRIVVNVRQQKDSYFSIQTGQIDSFFNSNVFESKVYFYSLSSGISNEVKKFSGPVILSFDIDMDMNHNAVLSDTGVDVSDAYSFYKIPFSNEAIFEIDYTQLHIAGM